MTTTSTSSTQVTPAAPVVSTWVANWETFIKAHEKIVLTGVIATVLFAMYSKGISAWTQNEVRKAVADKTFVKTDTQSNADLTKQIQEQNVALNKQAQAQATQLAAIKNQIESITAAELAKKMGGTSVDPTTVVLPLNTAKNDEVSLEQLPIVESELASEKTLNDTQAALITGLNKQLVDSENVCKAEVNAEKAKTKRAFVRGLKIGGIAGFVAGIFVGIH